MHQHQRPHETTTPATIDALNRAATFWPARPEEPGTLPALEVAGVMVFAYLTEAGELLVSVDLDTASPVLTSPRQTVPLRITVQGTTVYQAA